MTWLGGLLLAGAVAWLVHFIVWRKELTILDEGPCFGDLQGWEVRIVEEADGKRCIGIAIEVQRSEGPNVRFYAVLSPAQARQLARWIRVAAAPGKTLAIAKMNVMKEAGSHGGAIMRDRFAD